jgi:predicted DNA-binding WGR domain protein
MAYLTRTDPTRNINRFYVVDITPTLFGEWTLLREWGRRGSPSTLRLDSYQRREEAQSAEQRTIKRRLQRGYTARSLDARAPRMVCRCTQDRFLPHRVTIIAPDPTRRTRNGPPQPAPESHVFRAGPASARP